MISNDILAFWNTRLGCLESTREKFGRHNCQFSCDWLIPGQTGFKGDQIMNIIRICTATALLAAGQASAVEYVVNGGFELPAVAPTGFANYGNGSTIGGWTVGGNDVIVLSTTYAEAGLVFNANSGLASLDITGGGNTGPGNSVSQTLATTAGQYRISFSVGNASPTGGNAFAYGDPSSIGLSINGGPVSVFTNSINTPFAINWKRFSVTFFTPGATNITFNNATASDNMAGLDDVSVTSAVPEASSWAMLIVGFGLTGLITRSRRRRPVPA